MGMSATRYFQVIDRIRATGRWITPVSPEILFDNIPGVFRSGSASAFYDWARGTGYWSEEDLRAVEPHALLDLMEG